MPIVGCRWHIGLGNLPDIGHFPQNGGKGGFDTSFDTEHLPEGFLIAMGNLKVIPGPPVIFVPTGIGHLGAVGEYRTGPINFLQGSFHIGKVQTQEQQMRVDSQVYRVDSVT